MRLFSFEINTVCNHCRVRFSGDDFTLTTLPVLNDRYSRGRMEVAEILIFPGIFCYI
jgi:hypothetical protein